MGDGERCASRGFGRRGGARILCVVVLQYVYIHIIVDMYLYMFMYIYIYIHIHSSLQCVHNFLRLDATPRRPMSSYAIPSELICIKLSDSVCYSMAW